MKDQTSDGMCSSFSKRMSWFTVLNALDKSRKISSVYFFWSLAAVILSSKLSKANEVEL